MAETGQVGGTGMQRAGEAGAGVTGGGPAEKALAMAAAMRERLMAMPPGKRTWLIASGVVLAAVGAGVIWCAGRADWRGGGSGGGGEEGWAGWWGTGRRGRVACEEGASGRR